MSNPDYITDFVGARIVTDELLADLLAPLIDEMKMSYAEIGKDIWSREEWLAIIKRDIARLPNILPAEFDDMEGGFKHNDFFSREDAIEWLAVEADQDKRRNSNKEGAAQ